MSSRVHGATFSTELRWLLPHRCLHCFTVCIECFCIGTCISTKIESDAGVGPHVLGSNIFEAWLVRILTMKVLNHFKSIGKIGSRFPSPFTHFVTLPMNQIFQFFMVDARIKDFGNFEFFFAINFDWRWRCLQPT